MCVPSVSLVVGQLHVVVDVSFVVVGDFAAWFAVCIWETFTYKTKKYTCTYIEYKSTSICLLTKQFNLSYYCIHKRFNWLQNKLHQVKKKKNIILMIYIFKTEFICVHFQSKNWLYRIHDIAIIIFWIYILKNMSFWSVRQVDIHSIFIIRALYNPKYINV